MGAYATVKYLTHAFPDLYKKVKLNGKSVVLCVYLPYI